MSATFKLAKKKVSQHELRRLMVEQKKNSRDNNELGSVKRIESSFAKYEDNQLSCQLCKKKLSPSVWKVHINSKQHKENLELAKQLKEKLENQTKAPTRVIQERVAAIAEQRVKGIKGILKNSSTYSSNSATIETSDANLKPVTTIPQVLDDFPELNKKSQDEGEKNKSGDEKMLVDEALPEGFFDDPVKDAKARNLEYKNPIEEEWEKFRKEIKEAEVQSMSIITEEQEELTAERQIDEIDAQIKNWSRVLELEKKKEKIGAKTKCEVSQEVATGSPSSSEDEEDLPEFLDWRAKKGHK